MRIQVAVPEAHVDKPILDAMLESVTRLDEKLIEKGASPTFDQVVGRIRWKPEPPGQEHFDHALEVLKRGNGDCDDLAPFAAASMRITGEDPGARAVVYRSGPDRWHAVVERSDGSIRDPSEEAGMGRPSGVSGAALPLMSYWGAPGVSGAYEMRPELAVRPVDDGNAWEARLDIPWKGSKDTLAMTTLHQAPIAAQAIVGACIGGLDLGEDADGIDSEHLARVAAIVGYLDGYDWHELAQEYGEDHATAAEHVVGSLFGGIANVFKKVANNPIVNPLKLAEHLPGPFGGLARMANPAAILNPRQLLTEAATNPLFRRAVSFVPGVGPIAAQALEMGGPMVAQMLARHGGGMPGMPPGMGMPFGGGMPGMPPGMGMPFGGGMPGMPPGMGMPFGMPSPFGGGGFGGGFSGMF